MKACIGVAALCSTLLLWVVGCGGSPDDCPNCESSDEPSTPGTTMPSIDPACYEPYASELLRFTAGFNAGYGESKLPGVILGPSLNGSISTGSIDVLSLGSGGVIDLGFGDKIIVNGTGPDFVVWENAFWANGDSTMTFAELGEVSVSMDGSMWHTFPCDPLRTDGYDLGCAGWRPRQAFDACTMIPIDPNLVGGDQFDLSDLGLDEIRYVRIRDLSETGASPTAGFDLDAVGAIHFRE